MAASAKMPYRFLEEAPELGYVDRGTGNMSIR